MQKQKASVNATTRMQLEHKLLGVIDIRFLIDRWASWLPVAVIRKGESQNKPIRKTEFRVQPRRALSACGLGGPTQGRLQNNAFSLPGHLFSSSLPFLLFPRLFLLLGNNFRKSSNLSLAFGHFEARTSCLRLKSPISSLSTTWGSVLMALLYLQ